MRVRVKICGLTSPRDARLAAFAGADAVGLVFTRRSKRQIDIAQAQAIAAALPPFIARVALFMDDGADLVDEVLAHVPIDVLQFHGRETAEFCQRFARPYLKAVPMGEPGVSLAQWARDHAQAQALLLDANRLGEPGGSGRRFDWQTELEEIDRPIVIAGGLEPDNVATVIQRFKPYAVDVSSGVEAKPGLKDGQRMHAFVEAVNQDG